MSDRDTFAQSAQSDMNLNGANGHSYFGDHETHFSGIRASTNDATISSGSNREGAQLDRDGDVGEEADDDEELEAFTAAQIKVDQTSQYTPSAPSINERAQDDSPFFAPSANGSPYKRPPYLHPSVSRLRSHYRTPSSSSTLNQPADPYLRLAPSQSSGQFSRPTSHHRTPSMRSDVSRQSSFHHPYGAGNLLSNNGGQGESSTGLRRRPESFVSAAGGSDVVGDISSLQAEEVLGDNISTTKLLPAFRWQTLKKASETLFDNQFSRETSAPSPRRSTLRQSISPTLDSQVWGKPTCMSVNGLIVVGTSGGWAVVLSFNQEVKYVLGLASICKDAGAVTAISISPDQTYVGVGHEQGHIYLYDLASPSKPARTAAPLPLQALATGRKEGHLIGTRIVSVEFVGKRHTAMLSGDETGRAFWWSLGKVMGVESNDVVRLLGNLPVDKAKDEGTTTAPGSPSRPGSLLGPDDADSPKPNAAKSIWAAAPLPLGPRTHFSDQYSFMALLTPSKLVIVGLQPRPRTWYRKLRKRDVNSSLGRGCAAWLPAGTGDVKPPNGILEEDAVTQPALAYSWGRTIHILSLEQEETVPEGDESQDKANVMRGQPVFSDRRGFTLDREIESIHWYNARHLLLRTDVDLILLDVRTMRPVDQSLLPSKGRTRQTDALAMSAYKGRLFLLTSSKVGLGTLSTWADRILALCHTGDFLSAIDLAAAYYQGEAPGNDIGLPESVPERRAILHERLISLMGSSLDYAFAEDRMTDGTYHTPGSNGVDLTSLFETLADTCLSACGIMDDMEFAFEEVYDRYAQAGIAKLYLERLELFVYNSARRTIPPNLVQLLLKVHYDAGEYEQAEALIWQVEPDVLDVNQAINICQKQRLLDAYIYVHNSCLVDFTSPIVYIASLMERITDQRNNGPKVVGEQTNGHTRNASENLDKTAYEVYKVYSYLEKALCGFSYPDGRTMQEDRGIRAREDIYGYLFGQALPVKAEGVSGSMSGQTALRILYEYDPEALLHALDLAFEDTFLNEVGNARDFGRQGIVETLLDLVRGQPYRPGNLTFLYIFIARNLPKYAQFLRLEPAEMRNILDGLAKDEDQSTLADREYAAEYLLSRHTPDDPHTLHTLFDKAGFFRILETIYSREKRWVDLVDVLIRDPEATQTLFGSVEDVILASHIDGSGPDTEVIESVRKALPTLIGVSVSQTALALDRNAPELHEAALRLLEDRPDQQLTYYRCLLEPSLFEDTPSSQSLPPRISSSIHITPDQKVAYLNLLRVHEPSSLIESLAAQAPDYYPLYRILPLVEDLPQVSIWILDRMNEPGEAMALVADTTNLEGLRLVRNLEMAEKVNGTRTNGLESGMMTIQRTLMSGVLICQNRGKDPDTPPQLLRELWLTLLESEVRLVRSINAPRGGQAEAASPGPDLDRILGFVRGIIQDTFTSLIVSSSADAVPFPELFKRLVESARADDSDSKGTPYAEFRIILKSMLSSYSGEGESMRLAAKIFGADLHDLMKELLRRQAAGWKPTSSTCANCEVDFLVAERRKGFLDLEPEETGVLISACGTVTHVLCPLLET